MGRATKTGALAVTFTVTALALFGVLAYLQASHGRQVTWGFWGLCAVVAVFQVIAIVLDGSAEEASSETPPKPVRKGPAEPTSSAKRTRPRRVRVKRAVARTVPPVSGTTTALIVGSCMLVATILVPVALKKAVWIEGEMVLLVWWAVGVVTLTPLLYQGRRIADDRWRGGWPPYQKTSDQLPGKAPAPAEPAERLGCLDNVGCLWADELLVPGILVMVVFGVAWLLVELLLPAVFLVVYYLVVKLLGRVLTDRHDCKHRLGRSLFFATLWSTLYVAPLVALVWLIGLARGM